MDCFLKGYKNTVKKEFIEYGFKVHKTNFYRVINDVFQSFNLHRSLSGDDVTVEFLVIPLADGYIIDRDRCGYTHLKMFEKDNLWFRYNRNSEKNVDECIKEIVCYMKKHLIPFFESTCSCDKIYSQILNNKYVDFLEQAKCNVALKMHDYNMAAECINKEIEQLKTAYMETMKNSNDDNFKENYKVIVDKKISEKTDFLNHIVNNDYIYLNEWLRENEKKNKELLGVADEICL